MKKFILTASAFLILLGSASTFIGNAQDASLDRYTITTNTQIKTETIERVLIKNEVVEIPVYEEPTYTEMKVMVTAYCSEQYHHICNNGDFDSTSTGTIPTIGRTIAVDPNMIPYGSLVEMDGTVYIAEDTGGAIKDNRIDVLVNTHQEALEFGVQYKTIKIYEENSYES